MCRTLSRDQASQDANFIGVQKLLSFVRILLGTSKRPDYSKTLHHLLPVSPVALIPILFPSFPLLQVMPSALLRAIVSGPDLGNSMVIFEVSDKRKSDGRER